MSSASPRVYGGVDADARRAERRARLLEAGLDLLGTGGLQATTLRKVCEHAGLAARYFYESFPDLDSLIVAVFDDIVEQLVRAGTEALADAPADTRGRLRTGLGTAIDFIGDDPRKGHVVLTVAMGSPPLAERRLSAGERIARLVADRTRDAYGDGEAPSDRHLILISRFLVGGFAETLTAWMRDPSTPRDRLLDECVELFLATTSALATLRASDS
ncbi:MULTISPECIES: TetR/AcrR family transcriptional regulator [Actinomadura]|uniref:TetR/AcrR family transcriptional regulator n=1 Tax=Actinomadura yumaensis TaxID=111807 RepID=A0ABW2CCD9_9ACTN|nr:TetR/AcrR family transcriptional regulator [Actinomadura sp. J1-007]